MGMVILDCMQMTVVRGLLKVALVVLYSMHLQLQPIMEIGEFNAELIEARLEEIITFLQAVTPLLA